MPREKLSGVAGFLKETPSSVPSWQSYDELLPLFLETPDKVGIDVSENCWDCEMITSYIYVCKNNSQQCMVCNGNGFGAADIGYASLDIT